MPTDSYFYIARHLENCMMIFNMRVCPVRTQMTNTNFLNDYEMSMQKIPNLHVCSLERIKKDKCGQKRIGCLF